jgi:hypothetical protein
LAMMNHTSEKSKRECLSLEVADVKEKGKWSFESRVSIKSWRVT